MLYNFDTTYTTLDSNLFQKLNIPEIKDPDLILLNSELFQQLGIELKEDNFAKELLEINSVTKPFAQAYSGHQFGYFTNLGDGRAMILGEQITPDNQRFDIQLKGSGITKYSRGGDGKATMSSMIREYIYSYAMEKLNIATSQSLAIISSNQKVMRYSLHDGAILFRVMKSHIRFGTFEYISKFCSNEVLENFADYVINRHYPEFNDMEQKYFHLFKAVTQKTIEDRKSVV